MAQYTIGLDIGGTKIEAVLLQESTKETALKVGKKFFDVKQKKRVPTERDLGYQHVFSKIVTLIKELMNQEKTDISNIHGIGIGLPGSVHPKSNIMLAGNSAIFVDQDISKDLKESLVFSGEVILDNDANLFALAETFWGAGKHFSRPANQLTSVGIILGTGCGGGIVIQGKVLRGSNGGGGEIGHTQLISGGEPCYCGRIGCAEGYLSGTGLQNTFEKLAGFKKSGVEIFDGAQNKDEKCLEALKIYKEQLKTFLTNLTNIFDPDLIVLGGGVSNQNLIYENIEKDVQQLAFIPHHPVKVCKNELGDSAGVLGAALLPII